MRKSGSARRFVARPYAVAHECDLAVLTIDDDDFWRRIWPLELGGVPHLRDGVTVVGYPEGGDSLCVTSGVVSRIELQARARFRLPARRHAMAPSLYCRPILPFSARATPAAGPAHPYAPLPFTRAQVYEHSGASLLCLQIDAAINPGNSGGPAFDAAGRVVGVAFQNAPESQSIGYVIPVPIVNHFLRDIRENGGTYAGFPSIGVVCQHTENPQLRERLGLPKQGGGILVRGVHPLAAGPAEHKLRPDDVILSISGVEIASDGTCEVNAQERVSFAHLVHMNFPGDTCRMRVLREGRELELDVPALRLERLVPDAVERAPCYFIYGGVVFMPLTMGFLHEYGEDWYEDAPRDLVALWEHGMVTQPGEQVVVLSRILAAKETVGYGALSEKRVKSVNGQPVRNFRQLFLAVRQAAASGEPYVELALESPGGDAVLIIKNRSAPSVDETVSRTYRIPQLISDGSRGRPPALRCVCRDAPIVHTLSTVRPAPRVQTWSRSSRSSSGAKERTKGKARRSRRHRPARSRRRRRTSGEETERRRNACLSLLVHMGDVASL